MSEMQEYELKLSHAQLLLVAAQNSGDPVAIARLNAQVEELEADIRLGNSIWVKLIQWVGFIGIVWFFYAMTTFSTTPSGDLMVQFGSVFTLVL